MKAKLFSKLKRKEYRDAHVASRIRIGIPHQIKAIRESRNITQAELGTRIGKTQNAISRLENPDYGNFSLRTLLQIASSLDVALLVKFVPFSKFQQEFEDVSPQALTVQSFDEELPYMETVSTHNQSVTSGDLSEWVRDFVPVYLAEKRASYEASKSFLVKKSIHKLSREVHPQSIEPILKWYVSAAPTVPNVACLLDSFDITTRYPATVEEEDVETKVEPYKEIEAR